MAGGLRKLEQVVEVGGPEAPDPLEQMVQQVVDAENDGFECAWFGQIFGADSMTIIAMAGARTSRIEIGTSVIPTYTRHPWAMAQQAAPKKADAP